MTHGSSRGRVQPREHSGDVENLTRSLAYAATDGNSGQWAVGDGADLGVDSSALRDLTRRRGLDVAPFP